MSEITSGVSGRMWEYLEEELRDFDAFALPERLRQAGARRDLTAVADLMALLGGAIEILDPKCGEIDEFSCFSCWWSEALPGSTWYKERRMEAGEEPGEEPGEGLVVLVAIEFLAYVNEYWNW